MKDTMNFIKKCDKFQRDANLHHAPSELLHSTTTPWPFYQWGVVILETFLIPLDQLKFLIVWVDYFTKWIKAQDVSKITTERLSLLLAEDCMYVQFTRNYHIK